MVVDVVVDVVVVVDLLVLVDVLVLVLVLVFANVDADLLHRIRSHGHRLVL